MQTKPKFRTTIQRFSVILKLTCRTFFYKLGSLTVSSITNIFTTALSPPIQLCADTNLTNMQRQLALEVIVTLSETAAAMLRKHTAIVAQSGEGSLPPF